MKVHASNGDKTLEFLLAEKYPLALCETGALYMVIDGHLHMDDSIYDVYECDEPKIELYLKDDDKIHYIDIDSGLWSRSSSFDDYMKNRNLESHSLEEITGRLREEIQAGKHSDVTELIELRRNEYGEFVAKCKVRNQMYFKHHVFYKAGVSEYMVYVTDSDKEPMTSKLKLLWSETGGKRRKTFDESIGYFDRNAYRSVYIDFPILIESKEI